MPECSSHCVPEPSFPGVHLWLVLFKAHRAIGQVAQALRKTSCLGESEFRVLEVLLHKGPLPVNVIGPKVDLVPGSISVAVDRLYGRGLVSRTEDPDDRRIRLVDLTAAGKLLIEGVFRYHAANLEKIMSVLSDDERIQLESLLKRVGRHAEVVGGQASAGGQPCQGAAGSARGFLL